MLFALVVRFTWSQGSFGENDDTKAECNLPCEEIFLKIVNLYRRMLHHRQKE